jgi:signal transduction histidine kinase/CheY-like chemotaxis protein
MTAGIMPVADFAGIDRLSVWRHFTAPDGARHTSQIYRWERKSGGTTAPLEAYKNVTYAQLPPQWEELFSAGESINTPVAALPEAAWLQSLGLVSLFAVPVFINKAFWGVVLYEDHKNERYFDDDCVDMLRHAALILANAAIRSETEREIAEMEAFTRLMIDASPFSNQLWDRDLNIIACSEASATFFDLRDKQEFVERFYECSPEYQPNGRRSCEQVVEYLRKAFEEGACDFDWMHRMPGDGAPIPTKVNLVRIKYKSDYVVAGYIQDLREYTKMMEERRNTSRQLEIALEKAKEANRAKSAFLATMSHEIRTPMNGIMGFAELALNSAVVPQVREYLKNIVESTKWLLHIINDILDISKIESGKMELEKAPFDLHEVFMRCQSVSLPRVNEKGLELRVYAEPAISKKLLGDQVRLYQILENLLSNAVKFTNTGTVSLSAVIKEASDSHTTICFEVRDTGIGMTPAQTEKIFDSFVQADSSTTRNYGGSGLGLAIARDLVEMMGGALSVESAPGVGSAFRFVIGFENASASNGSASNFSRLEKALFDAMVVVCDENYMNRQMLGEHLSQVGIRAVTAENGAEGVEKVRERLERNEPPFDMIFMDIYMPIMDGYEAATRIVALNTGAPIITVTANLMRSELEKYKNYGMAECLGKPFTSQELWRILLKYLPVLRTDQTAEAGQTQSDAALQNKFRLHFVKDNQDVYTRIMDALQANDLTLAHRLAHTLKGNAGMIGKTGLQNIAADIEAQLKCRAIPIPEAMMNRLKMELTPVLEELEPLLSASPPQGKVEPLDHEQALAVLEKLEPMLKKRSRACIELLADIRAIPGAEELASQIERYDFKLAFNTLAHLKNQLEVE